jgi:hypothetical protein
MSDPNTFDAPPRDYLPEPAGSVFDRPPEPFPIEMMIMYRILADQTDPYVRKSGRDELQRVRDDIYRKADALEYGHRMFSQRTRRLQLVIGAAGLSGFLLDRNPFWLLPSAATTYLCARMNKSARELMGVVRSSYLPKLEYLDALIRINEGLGADSSDAS